MASTLRHILIPGGGGSGPKHWHHRWAEDLANCEWVHQIDPSGGSRAEWIDTINTQINSSREPAILIAHSLACIAVAHWAALWSGPVMGALLVAPADIDDDWAEPDSLYKRFQPIPMQALPFPTTVVASSNDPLLSLARANELASAWGSGVVEIGDHLHIGSDAELDRWPQGRTILDALVRLCVAQPE